MAGIELLVRAGCHVCAESAVILDALAGPEGGRWRMVDVDRDPELQMEWGDMVPVLLVGERVVDWGAVSADSVRAALELLG